MEKPIRFPKVEWEIKAEKPQGNFNPTVEIKFGFEVKEGELWWRPFLPKVVMLFGEIEFRNEYVKLSDLFEEVGKYLYKAKRDGNMKIIPCSSGFGGYGREYRTCEGSYYLILPCPLLDHGGNLFVYSVLVGRGYYAPPNIAKEKEDKTKWECEIRAQISTCDTNKGKEYVQVLAEALEEAASLFPDLFKDGLEKEKEGFSFYRSSKTSNLSACRTDHSQTKQRVAEFV